VSTQRTIIVNNRFQRSHSADNSCCLTPTPYTWKYVLFETRISHAGGSECGNRLSGVKLPTFQQCSAVTMSLSCLVFEIRSRDRRRTDGRKTDVATDSYLAAGQQKLLMYVIVIIYSAITVATLTHIHWLVSILVWKLDSSMLCHVGKCRFTIMRSSDDAALRIDYSPSVRPVPTVNSLNHTMFKLRGYPRHV